MTLRLAPNPSPTIDSPSLLAERGQGGEVLYWLVQSSDAHPDLKLGIAPPGSLTAEEQAQFATLKIEKRRCDWLLGRWTARRLLNATVPNADNLSVLVGLDGAPVVTMPGGRAHPSISLSISHSNGLALCALVANQLWTVGADIERIVPHTDDFIADYFTVTEREQVRRLARRSRDMIVTAIWSAKEAALKALHLGLTVDTRSLSCLICPADSTNTWTPFDIEWHAAPTPSLFGWWRTMQDYTLTLVARHIA